MPVFFGFLVSVLVLRFLCSLLLDLLLDLLLLLQLSLLLLVLGGARVEHVLDDRVEILEVLLDKGQLGARVDRALLEHVEVLRVLQVHSCSSGSSTSRIRRAS